MSTMQERIERMERSEAIVDIKTEEWGYSGSELTEKVYKVGSAQNGGNGSDKFYRVKVNANGLECDCPDAQYRGQGCKHSMAVLQKIQSQ